MDRREHGGAPRALLIDLDGTMVDTAPDLAAAAALMLAGLGRPPLALSTVAGFIGNGVPALVARVLAASGLAGAANPVDPAAAEASFVHHYTGTNGRHGRAYRGALDGVAALRRAGFPLACVTNKPQALAEALLGTCGLLPHFDHVVGGDTPAGLKPSAGPLLHACRLLGVAPQRALMVGDSAIDVAAARAAGMPVWLVRHGYPGAGADTSSDSATAAGADGYIDDLGQLAARLAAPPSHPNHPPLEGIEP
ncbi:phosphoglycolate phosphatase [Burkholderia sp. LMU1-1-1.1]|uniref:phosphoglycolate phosphatase n=1 Tax=Burkholderia sp. LMU1-1-1.1 TaxID=3135266 RepID=UPI0034200787